MIGTRWIGVLSVLVLVGGTTAAWASPAAAQAEARVDHGAISGAW
jgi:hypothetical protein